MTDFSKTFNPATGKLVAEVPMNTVEELRTAVAAARSAQSAWGALSIEDRIPSLLRVRDYITANADHIALAISAETGKTRMDALSTEVMPGALAVNYYAKHAGRVLRRKRLGMGSILLANKRSYVDRVPVGVVGIISPWNYPFGIPVHEVAMAVMAGNAVVLKVASQTLQVGAVLLEAFRSGGMPSELIQLVNLPGSVAGDAFLDSGIDKLFFTGSVAVGKKLMAKAAERLLPVSLELGGNDAMIVCADANLHRAVAGALWAGFSNAGQSCAGVERIFVEEPVYEEFVRLLKKKMSALRMGADDDGNVEIGSMTTKAQHRKVQSMLEDAVQKGAAAYAPGRVPENGDGLFLAPVLLTEVNNTMRVMQEEVFGPILSVARVATTDDAVRSANDSALGLTASVWSRNRRKAHAIASRLEAGAVTINDHLMSHGLAETPWGGFKQSALGRTHGYLGLEEMTHPRVVVDDIMPGVQKNMWWYPHDRTVYDGLKGALDLLFGKGFLRRLRGGVKVSKTFMRTFRRG